MSPNDELELNAYLDGELSADQQAEFLEAMREDPELARRVCELGQLKAQLRLAYAEPPRPRQRPVGRVRASWAAIAASIGLVALGLTGGWLLSQEAYRGDTSRFVLLDPAGRGQAPAVAENEETRIVFHLTNPDPMIGGELLDEVENLLRAYAADERPLRVEVVSHSDGLDLLRKSLTAHENRINEMAEQFSNLTFVACKNTIDRLRIDHGIEVQLVPAAEVIDSGVSHVVRRQKEGWSYIRV